MNAATYGPVRDGGEVHPGTPPIPAAAPTDTRAAAADTATALTSPRDEKIRLAALVDADRRQLGFLDEAIGSLYESRRIVRERMEQNQARLRSSQARHYADLNDEVQAS